ncbi:MAG: 4-hydroxy-3-methylbut-2-enyl diphosphate reductase [Gammaproteobacteria bacterium]|nr:4-hydroxy-3-methylbut-2-enyl diphosphate reductase [Gammaproteobacteria bacterium]
MDVLLAQPRGFCAGVARAIDIAERTLAMHGAPVYIFHEIVHNGHVVGDLAARGAIFVENIEDIPEGSVTVFSAHGVATAVVEAAARRKLQVIDATCPLVTKVHLQAQRYSQRGFTIVVVGHAGHEEVEGTRGSIKGPVHVVGTIEEIAALPMGRYDPVAYVTQTTLSMDDTRELIDALEQRYPDIVGPGLDDICYATLNRQRAVQQLARRVDLVIVVGAQNSSNSNRLQEVAAADPRRVPATTAGHLRHRSCRSRRPRRRDAQRQSRSQFLALRSGPRGDDTRERDRAARHAAHRRRLWRALRDSLSAHRRRGYRRCRTDAAAATTHRAR